MSTSLTKPNQSNANSPLAPSTPTADRLKATLMLAADRCFPITCPPQNELDQAHRELSTAIETRAPAGYAARAVGGLILAYPQKGPQEPAIYIAAMTDTASEYPADIVASACRTLLRGSKFIPTVADFVEAAEEAMRPRRAMLRGVTLLRAEALERLARREEEERRARNRRLTIQRMDDAISDRYGATCPEWFSVERAWVAITRCQAKLGLLIEDRAAAGDIVAYVQLRRASLFGLALDLEQKELRGPRYLFAAEVLQVGKLLVEGQDRAATSLVLSAAENAKPTGAGGEHTSWADITATMRETLSQASARRAAIAEGLILDVEPTERVAA